jgi:phosphoribosylformimino-5-aminoimidazole carboxamide ribotide isomerase
VHTDGWQEAAATTALELATHWATRGVRWIVFTDVSRDGMGSGLNLRTTMQLAQVAAPSATDVPSASGQAPSASQRGELVEPSGQVPSAGTRRRLHVIASGGVASLADVRQAYQAGLSGVIIGRALTRARWRWRRPYGWELQWRGWKPGTLGVGDL